MPFFCADYGRGNQFPLPCTSVEWTQGLVKVLNEVKEEFQGLPLFFPGRIRVKQHPLEILDLADDAPARLAELWVVTRLRERNVDVVPGSAVGNLSLQIDPNLTCHLDRLLGGQVMPFWLLSVHYR
jgi:hypothetical protein